ncbi:MAG: hypothetical protein JRI66_09170 [Deltaproteobacteria bacterium]|nr:hypothetical protein [Deltaproteobacteria bacterium]
MPGEEARLKIELEDISERQAESSWKYYERWLVRSSRLEEARQARARQRVENQEVIQSLADQIAELAKHPPEEPEEKKRWNILSQEAWRLPQLAMSAASGAVGGWTGSPTLGGFAGAGISALSSAGPLGLAAAGGMGIGVVAYEVFQKMNDVVSDLAESVSGLAPAVVTAEAMREVRLFQARLERAERMGDQLGKLVEVQTDLQIAWEDLKTQVGQVILPAVITVTKTLQSILEIAQQVAGAMPKGGEGEVALTEKVFYEWLRKQGGTWREWDVPAGEEPAWE